LGSQPAVGGIFPFFLSPQRREVEESHVGEAFGAAAACMVSVINGLVVVNEDAEAKDLAFLGGEAQILVEVGAFRGIPGIIPAHALFVFLDFLEWGQRDEAKRSIAGVNMGHVPELIGDKRAAEASRIGPS